MIFLAAMPLLFAFMNAIVPLQIGARDVAYPFVNALGFWLFFFRRTALEHKLVPRRSTGCRMDRLCSAFHVKRSRRNQFFYVLGLQIAGIGTLIGGINFLVTIINMRAPGMTFMRMPLFTWTAFVTSALILFAFPVITVGLVQLMFDRIF